MVRKALPIGVEATKRTRHVARRAGSPPTKDVRSTAWVLIDVPGPGRPYAAQGRPSTARRRRAAVPALGGATPLSAARPRGPIGRAGFGRRAGAVIDVTVDGDVREWQITFVG